MRPWLGTVPQSVTEAIGAQGISVSVARVILPRAKHSG